MEYADKRAWEEDRILTSCQGHWYRGRVTEGESTKQQRRWGKEKKGMMEQRGRVGIRSTYFLFYPEWDRQRGKSIPFLPHARYLIGLNPELYTYIWTIPICKAWNNPVQLGFTFSVIHTLSVECTCKSIWFTWSPHLY